MFYTFIHVFQEVLPSAFLDLYDMLVGELRARAHDTTGSAVPHSFDTISGGGGGVGGGGDMMMVKKGKSCYWSLVSCYRRKRMEPRGDGSGGPVVDKRSVMLQRMRKLRELGADA